MPRSPAPSPAALEALLRRHLPVVAFDSGERFFPVSAQAWTDCPGHVLRRSDGTVLAEQGAVTTAALELSYLGAEHYGDATAVHPGDVIAGPGPADHASAERFQGDPRYADRVYGRAQPGSDGRLWLQYRWFYFYNDYRLLAGHVRVGVHEGDWEMIQLALPDADSDPVLALYTHHRRHETRPWREIERIGERPVVYVARGSHGCYFSAGTHWTGVWFDHADGRVDRGAQTLEILDDGPAQGWARWPGRWGGTLTRPGLLGVVDGQSPAGPGAPFLIRWRDPAVLLASARR